MHVGQQYLHVARYRTFKLRIRQRTAVLQVRLLKGVGHYCCLVRTPLNQVLQSQSAATRCRYGVESKAPTQSSQENAKAP